MDFELEPITPSRLAVAIHFMEKNADEMKTMFADDEAREKLSCNVLPYLQGILKMFAAQDKEKDEEKTLELDDHRLRIMSISLVQIGIAIGRHYECNACDAPRIARTISMSEAYKICDVEDED